MASASSTSKAFFTNMLFISALLATAVLVSGFQYEVGEKTGWKKPTGKEPETFNEWAARNRFHIGDTLNFKYHNDSVLVVSPVDYITCNTSNPISRFEDGNTVFEFDRSGFFYFISGQPGHCRSGQRLIVRVMHPTHAEAPVLAPVMSPELAPSPAMAPGVYGGESGGVSGESGVSSAVKISVVSSVVTVLVGLSVAVVVFLLV